jgi:hypothetical protein
MEGDMDLNFDEARYNNEDMKDVTGIYIRAKTPSGNYDTGDIAQLDKKSLLSWLKSRGGDNAWAEDCVGIILGYGHLHI